MAPARQYAGPTAWCTCRARHGRAGDAGRSLLRTGPPEYDSLVRDVVEPPPGGTMARRAFAGRRQGRETERRKATSYVVSLINNFGRL